LDFENQKLKEKAHPMQQQDALPWNLDLQAVSGFGANRKIPKGFL
jgi:hypothetical protein